MSEKIFFYKILKKTRKKQILLLIILSFFLSFTEVLSIASIAPLITIMLYPNTTFDNGVLQLILSKLSSIKYFDLHWLLSGFFLLFIFFSWLIKSINLKLKLRLSNYICSDLQQILFKNYISQNYESFTLDNSDSFVTKITLLITRTGSYLSALFNIFISILISTSIIIFLIYLNYKITFITLISISFFFGVIFLFKTKLLKKIGNQISTSQNEIVEISTNTKGYIAEIIIYNLKKMFIKNFNSATEKISENNSNYQILGNLPRIHLEYSILLLIILILTYLNISGFNQSDITFLLALAISTQKLLPLINNIYNSSAEMRTSKPAYNEIINYIYKKTNIESSQSNYVESDKLLDFKKNIKISNLNFSYKNKDKNTIQDLNLIIENGEMLGVKGKTGSGKTTFINLISFLIFPTSGDITIDGQLITNRNLRLWQNNISYVGQNYFLHNTTIKENIAIGLNKNEIDLDRVKYSCKLSCADEFIEKLPNKYNEKITNNGLNFSGGQKQRLNLARAIYRNTKLIILDEPTSALDEDTEKEFLENLNKLKETTKIIISHNENVLKKCDRTIEIFQA